MIENLFLLMKYLLLAALLGVGATLSPLCAEPNYFGTAERGEAALIGILYDMKQNQRREPVQANSRTFNNALGEFILQGWDEGVLNQFFRVSTPLYTTQIFIPMMSANRAPQAFGVDDVVEPRYWVVHYRGQVSPQEAGVYRFAGSSDDFLAVGVNEEIVLIAPRPSYFPTGVDWRPQETGHAVPNGSVRYGDWFSVEAGEVIDLDVLVGEAPGGQFNAYLYIQRQGDEYPTRGGHPVLPIFKTAPSQDLPNADAPFSPDTPANVWRAHQ